MRGGKQIGILGAGTWGIALARILQLTGHQVTVWSAIAQEIEALSHTHRHPNLPGMEIPGEMVLTKDLEQACKGKDILLFAVPSVYVRATARKAAPFVARGQLIVDVAKGMEADTLFTMSQIIEQELKDPTARLVALSGPTHAEEVAKDLPTTIVAASRSQEAAKQVQEAFAGTCMRVYTNGDILGVELCGAMKNVIALAAGVASGLGYGDNTKAALITRGLAEITRLGMAMGCLEQTFGGLAGMGDLIVTATSRHSRNNRCGMLLGQGKTVTEATREVGMVVEGLNALPAAIRLKEKYGVEMPIVDAVAALVNGHIAPAETVAMLMERDQKSELPPGVLGNCENE